MSPAVSRLAALALTLLLAGGIVGGIVLPLAGRLDGLAGEIAVRERQLAAFAARLSDAGPEMRIEVAEPALLARADPALAGAALQERLDRAVEETGAVLRSLAADRAEPAGESLLRVPAELAVVTDMAGLRALLHAIETGRPYLAVERLEIRRLDPRDEAEGLRLAVRLRVAGYLARPVP